MGSTNRDTIWYNEASVRQMDHPLHVTIASVSQDIVRSRGVRVAFVSCEAHSVSKLSKNSRR